jgi:hypothetical protein
VSFSKKSTIWRPTEAAALGNVPAPKLPSPALLWEDLARAVRLQDRRGALLIRKLLVRCAAAGLVGER